MPLFPFLVVDVISAPIFNTSTLRSLRRQEAKGAKAF